MSELSQREQNLLAAARRGLEPTDADRNRLRSALAATLAAGTPSAEGAGSDPASLSPGAGAGWLGATMGAGARWVTGVLLLGASFGGGYWMGRQHVVPPPASEAAAPIPAASVAASPSSERAQQPRGSAPPLPTTSAEATLPRPKHNAPRAATSAGLAAEVALLQRAQRAVRNGDYSTAHTVLGQLDEEFPRGALREEREAIRVLVHCRANPGSAALEMGRDFERTYPASVYVDRVRMACRANPITFSSTDE